jgi:hypothetical protein
VQPFGGFVSEFRQFEGYRPPARVEGGNFVGIDAYFPFYKACVDDLRFIGPDQRRRGRTARFSVGFGFG